jgi:chromosomal replication initiation ATPase DnaA
MAYRIKIDGLEIECDTLEEMWAAKTLVLERMGAPAEATKRDVKPANIASTMILGAVARAADITTDELTGRSRVSAILIPRHVACYLLRTVGGQTFEAIAGLVGRDHTTVISGCKYIERKLAHEPEGKEAKLLSRALDALALERAAGIATAITGCGSK